MKKLFLITAALVSALLFCSCEEEEMPHETQKHGLHIDENQLSALRVIYNSLHLADCKEYNNWIYRYGTPGSNYGIDSLYVTYRHGLTFEIDSVRHLYVVTKIDLSKLPQRNDISLPDVFESFSHLKSFIINVPGGASVEIPRTLCDCPLATLKINPVDWDGSRIVKGSLPDNFGKLGATLESLEICCTNLGNELLDYIVEFKNLKEGRFGDNNFTGKVPYLPWANSEFSFSNNHFTEFDWRYIETFDQFRMICDSIWPPVPYFRYNEITGPLPSYFNKDFFDYYRSNHKRRPGEFLNGILRGNQIMEEYQELYTKYTGLTPSL